MKKFNEVADSVLTEATKEKYNVSLTIDLTDRMAAVMDPGEVERVIKKALNKAFDHASARIKDIKVK